MSQPGAGGAPAAPPAIRVQQVTVHYGRTPALVDFSLDVATGETVALLGPSGSGKSTALKAVAGFVRPVAGRVWLAGRDVTELPPYARNIGVVVQQYALFPHLSVAANVAFGLRARHRSRAETAARVEEMLSLVGMAAYAKRRPRELSGGQQQRVAIARALAIRPGVLLLDEPLSALDAQLRADMLGELQRLRDELPDVAIIYVTHDQGEALALADRIAVMRDARLVDVDAAERLYRQPPSRFTASFLGGANLIPAVVARAGEVDTGGFGYAADTTGFSAGDKVLVCARPHALTVVPADRAGLPATLTGVQWRGASHRLTCTLRDAPVEVRVDVATLDAGLTVGGPVSVVPPPTGLATVSES
jgi:2-aminoethylphosphonate transport system ATP-binding protein